MFPMCGIGNRCQKKTNVVFNQETDNIQTPSGEQEASTKHSYVESDNQKELG